MRKDIKKSNTQTIENHSEAAKMSSLGMFDSVRESLRRSRKESVVALHKFVFECEGDRANRQRLREFEGFDYGETIAKYEQKATYVKAQLTLADLISICNLLGISYNADNLVLHIFKNLKKGCLFTSNIDEDTEQRDDDEEGNDDEGDDYDENVGEQDRKIEV